MPCAPALSASTWMSAEVVEACSAQGKRDLHIATHMSAQSDHARLGACKGHSHMTWTPICAAVSCAALMIFDAMPRRLNAANRAHHNRSIETRRFPQARLENLAQKHYECHLKQAARDPTALRRAQVLVRVLKPAHPGACKH